MDAGTVRTSRKRILKETNSPPALELELQLANAFHPLHALIFRFAMEWQYGGSIAIL